MTTQDQITLLFLLSNLSLSSGCSYCIVIPCVVNSTRNNTSNITIQNTEFDDVDDPLYPSNLPLNLVKDHQYLQ